MTAETERQTKRTVAAGRNWGFLILDRYIFREFAIAFFGVMSFCALLLLVASIFERFGKMMEQNTPIDKAVAYFACSMPFALVQAVPIASMLAVLFSVGGLARNKEVIAFLTSGVPAMRLAVPVIFGGFLIFAATVTANEYVIPPLQAKARLYEQLYIEGKSEAKVLNEKNVFARGQGNRFYLMRMYLGKERKMIEPEIVDLSDDYSSMLRRIMATSAQFVGRDPNSDGSLWNFEDPRIWTFDDKGTTVSFSAKVGSVSVLLEKDLARLLNQRKEPEEMNFEELHNHISMMEDRKQPTFSLRTDLINKISYPFGILLISLLGFSYSVRSGPGTAMNAFGYGVFFAMVYYGMTAVMLALGHSGTLSPMVAGAFTNAVFLVFAVYHLHRSARWHS